MSSEGLHYRVYAREQEEGYEKFRTYPGAIEYLMASLKPSVDGGSEVDDEFYLHAIKNRIKRCELVFQEKLIVLADHSVDATRIKRKYNGSKKNASAKNNAGVQSRIMSLIEGAGRKGIHTSRIMLELCQSTNTDFIVNGSYVYAVLSDLKKSNKIYCVKKIYRIKE